MDGWMDGWMDGLMDGWPDGWMDGLMDVAARWSTLLSLLFDMQHDHFLKRKTYLTL